MAREPRPLLTLEPSPANPRNSEGAFLVGADGEIAFAYTHFTGGSRDHSDAFIAMRRSPDGGRTWSDDCLLVPNEGRANVMSVSILPLPSGEVLLGYLVKNGWDDCRLAVRRSDDGLKTLSAPDLMTSEPAYYVVNNDRLVRLSSGRLLAPAALHPGPDGAGAKWDRRGSALCFLSDDEGRTWRRSPTVLPPPAGAGDSGLQEPGVVELAGGRLWMFMRTSSGRQWQSFSDDGGERWSDPVPSAIASPLSPASVKRIPQTGDLLMVWNDHSGRHPFPEGKRTPLCLAVSKDEGATWSPSRVLEADPEGWFCYTALEFLGEDVLLAYCAGDERVGRLSRLKLVAVPLAWIYADA